MPANQDKWLAIVNPVSGGGRGSKAWPEIYKLLRDNDIVPECLLTEYKYHAIELTVNAINEGFRKILVVGGDGTLHEVVNGLFLQQAVPATDITIGVVSVGTGNDWGRTYNFPHEYGQAVETILAGRFFLQDVGLVRYRESGYGQSRYIVNVAGFGFDSFVIEQYDLLKEKGKTGKLIYIWSLLKALITYRSSSVSISVDGQQTVNEVIFSAAVGIGRYNGGGMMQLPLAHPADGLLDLTTIRRISRLRVIRNLGSLFNGTLYNVREVLHHRGRHIKVEGKPDIVLEADGEILGNGPFEFEIVEKGIKVIVPEEFLQSDKSTL